MCLGQWRFSWTATDRQNARLPVPCRADVARAGARRVPRFRELDARMDRGRRVRRGDPRPARLRTAQDLLPPRGGLPGALADELAQHLAQRGSVDPASFVFTAPDGGPLRHTNFYPRHFKPAVRRSGIGNGYYARPVEMDCHFESICESCTFFVTTIEFRPTLQRQRDDAATKGQIGRQKVFDGLLNRLDD